MSAWFAARTAARSKPVTLLDEVAEKISGLSPADRQALVEQVAPLKEKMRFIPQEGPQTAAYLSDADVLLYGGQAGGGKTGLLVGLSQEHQQSILFRRELSQADGMEKFGKEVFSSKGFNGQDMEWNWSDGRSLKLAGLKEPGDWIKHAGRPRDLMGFDEAGDFLRDQVASLIAWNRGPIGQRCRIVLASNPPRTADGYWLTEWFAPWLDLQHPGRADPGELRWAVLVDEGSGLRPFWVDGPGEVELNSEQRRPLSFTFVPAKAADNKFLEADYEAKNLDNLPEPLRSQLKYGDFGAGVQDGFNQCIPTEWVKAAQRRWKSTPPLGTPMCSMGVDVAQGGLDQTVIAMRFDDWFAPLLAIPGAQTPGGTDVAGAVIAKRHDNATVVVDLGGGWGGEALAHLARNSVENATGYMGVDPSVRRTKDNLMRFFNVRTEAYWRLREALDPDQLGGATMALPPDKELLADLTAPTFTTPSGKGGRVIHLEPKEALVKRLGRSPDRGDAVVMAWHAGARNITDGTEWRAARPRIGGRQPKVIMGRQAAQRARGR